MGVRASNHPEAKWLSALLEREYDDISVIFHRLLAAGGGVGYFYAAEFGYRRYVIDRAAYTVLHQKSLDLGYPLAIAIRDKNYHVACTLHEWTPAYEMYGITFFEKDPQRYYWLGMAMKSSTISFMFTIFREAMENPPNNQVRYMIGKFGGDTNYVRSVDLLARQSIIQWILFAKSVLTRDMRRLIAVLVWKDRIEFAL